MNAGVKQTAKNHSKTTGKAPTRHTKTTRRPASRPPIPFSRKKVEMMAQKKQQAGKLLNKQVDERDKRQESGKSSKVNANVEDPRRSEPVILKERFETMMASSMCIFVCVSCACICVWAFGRSLGRKGRGK